MLQIYGPKFPSHQEEKLGEGVLISLGIQTLTADQEFVGTIMGSQRTV